MEQGDFAPEFPLEWALKDVDLAIGEAGGDTPPLLGALSRLWHGVVAVGLGREDVSATCVASQGLRQSGRSQAKGQDDQPSIG